MPTCTVKFEPEEYYCLLDTRLMGIVDNLLLHRLLETNEEFRWCKSTKGCGAGQLVCNYKDLLGYYTCHACGQMLCFRHSIEWHKGFTCDEFEAERARNDDLASDVTVLAFTKKCPNEACGTPIMKHEGCDVMTCCRFGSHTCAESKDTCDHGGRNYCGQRFCWSCLGKIDLDKKTNGFIRHCKPSCKICTGKTNKVLKMAENANLDNIARQNEEYAEYNLTPNKIHFDHRHSSNVNSGNSQERTHEIDMQQYDVEQSDSTVKKGKLQSFNSIVPTAGNFGVNEYDYGTIEIDNLRNKHLISGNVLDNEQAAEKRQYQRSISMNPESQQSRSPNMQKRKSLQMAFQNDDEKSEEFPNNVSSFKDLEEYKSTQLYPTSNNTKNSIPKSDQSEESKIKCNYHSSVSRLLEPTCEGIRSRIELLGELITSKKLDSIPDVYDEMAQIIASTERNERFMTGVDGKRLLELTTTAKSNLNIDLHNLDLEIQRQFGLYSVEVTGDGACAFRATLISGLQQPDLYQSELREKAIRHVLNDISYYSTVLRPGEKVSEQELKNWAYSMADSNTYGDEMANIAVADLYHIQLVIFRAGELLTVVNPRDGHVEHTAFLVNVGTHYKALVTVYELDEARRNSERISKHSM
ncbi:unnamed protein product [Rotaria magnacalcarata]|uniref:RBR-type E3 ubiquitin transferase n=1 Tax=Rotaria magnacalcarata TaxID=392030 RepID=A0A816ST86_9BILA|nr:unnamed protein product [Rotaria magnacalcarata]